jgi:hypothetical protein
MRERTALSRVARYSRMAALVGGMALLVLLASFAPNTSPGTRSSGPVIISTDHSVYATTERMHVTVTNHLPVDSYTVDHGASCSILGLERQTNGQWQFANSARCPLGRPEMPVRIASGHSYTATIEAGDGLGPVYYQATFSPGLYRLVLGYSTVAPASPAAFVQSSTTLASATLTQNRWFAPLGSWAFLLGAGLTVLLLGGNLVVAAQQRSWGLCLLLLVWPPFCFGCYAFCYAAGFGPAIVARWLFIPGIGLLNFLFACSNMQLRRETAPASLAAPDLPN